MTQFSLGVAAFTLFFCGGSISADEPPECNKTKFVGNLFTNSECSSRDGVTISTFLGPAALSPYATEFDRRTFVVARGQDAMAVRNVAGLIEVPRGTVKTQITLAQPPLQDQITRRDAKRVASSHRQWVVRSESVQYTAQGGVPGYVVECATAIRSKRLETVAAAECFSLEERKRFLRTLDALR